MEMETGVYSLCNMHGYLTSKKVGEGCIYPETVKARIQDGFGPSFSC